MRQISFQFGYDYIHDRAFCHHEASRYSEPCGDSSTEGRGLLEASKTIIKSNEWREKARYLDLVRGTRLGTLGYLPLEIRQMIWRNFFVYGHCSRALCQCNQQEEREQRQVAPNLPHEPQIFWRDHPVWGSAEYLSSSGLDDCLDDYIDRSTIFRLQKRSESFEKRVSFQWCRYQGLQDVSETIRGEIEALFFLAHQFTFKHPFDMMSFCELLPLVCRESLRHISIWLCYPDWPWGYYPWPPNALISERRYEVLVEAWKDSVRGLPETVSTVLVRIGEMDAAKRQLVMLRTVAESIKVEAKQATITICSEGNYGPLSDGNMVAYQAVLDDVMKHSS